MLENRCESLLASFYEVNDSIFQSRERGSAKGDSLKVLQHNSLDPIQSLNSQSSLTIGNFDGCHLGHQKLLEIARSIASEKNASTTVLTFDPHPREFFAPEIDLPRLFQPEQKLRALAEQNVDVLMIQKFDKDFAQLTPEEFCKKLVWGQLKAMAVTVGYDFRFGKGRAGKLEDFNEYLPHAIINEVGEVIVDGDVVSSSAIRKHLQASDIRRANALLGRAYLLEGKIQKGKQLGRKLGFPTANIQVEHQMLPKAGVYCGWATLEMNSPIFNIPANRIPCIMNIGYRPTIEQATPQLLVETHLLAGEYAEDSLYGLPISIYITDHIRGEKKFESLDALKEQIQVDSQAAKSILGCS
ncbi:MAG: bifunctional riboflavin kinase/FAD synthetase [Proteobacteria bacterium]|nr:MAG: bifunctional riboflavin kinase/FAD synthetase [Pseudomonadota bacterium]